MKNKPTITYFGTPEFSSDILEFVSQNFQVDLVISNPDKPVGRKKTITPTPVKLMAKQLGIPVFQPMSLSSEKTQQEILSFGSDLGLTVSYGKIIPKSLIDGFPKKILNIHFSLLPKYRGATPIRFPILNRENETGVTLFVLDENMDTGPIVSQRKIKIQERETYSTLLPKLGKLAKEIIVEDLENYSSGLLLPIPQTGNSSYCNFENSPNKSTLLSKKDGQINWSKLTEEIESQIRAFETFPTSWTFLQGQRFVIYSAEIREFGSQAETFEISSENNLVIKKEFQKNLNELLAGHLKIYPSVRVGDKFLIMQEYQLSGKKRTKLTF